MKALSKDQFVLIKEKDHLALFLPDTKMKPIFLDFLSKKFALRKSIPSQELLKRAIGITKNDHPTVIDATAGFGDDAFIIASFNCQVIMLERSPILSALLEDGLKRLNEATSAFKNRFILIKEDAIKWLSMLSQEQYPEVIYLDPMFPHRLKSALVKKKMQCLQALIGEDSDAPTLLGIALEKAKKRVVVKRPIAASPLGDQTPDFSIKGKQIRFDIYTRFTSKCGPQPNLQQGSHLHKKGDK